MKAVEFQVTITQERQIALPPEVSGEIPAGQQLRVVVMWEASDLGDDWPSAGRQRFEACYCPEDDVYEQLMDDAASR